MSRLETVSAPKTQAVLESIGTQMQKHILFSNSGICPVEFALNCLRMTHVQSCGKCVPCRIGLGDLAELIESVLDGKADMRTISLIEKTASAIASTADCAIGQQAAKLVLDGVRGFRDDYIAHVKTGRCIAEYAPVPCREGCPAHVDIPGYAALVREGRYSDAVRLIRKDNPMPVACAYICEHPCEAGCRRGMIDAPVNIRGLKRAAVDNAGEVAQPAPAPRTGKKVAVIGGGPGGLSCAYYLALMGHSVTIFDSKSKLGGMLRYGIPAYRFPREKLDAEIASILSLGIEVRTGVKIGSDISFEQICGEYDCVFIAIGAQVDRKAGMPGEDSKNVMSAISLLGGIGDGEYPDFAGKRVVIIGGGNVAMDATRTSVRLGADKVTCVYRRRQEDMTALPEEIEGAIAEGAELVTLAAPVRIEADENGCATALWVQPQIIGAADRSGRPAPCKADAPEERIPADIIIAAIGQSIDSDSFAKAGMATKRGAFTADNAGRAVGFENVFVGGDCVTGPATAIRALAAGKVAAANIDEYLGFNHEISVDVDIPLPRPESLPPYGRVNTSMREAEIRKNDFEDIECGMSAEGSCQEASRCLRCDHFGCGSFRGGRIEKW